MTTRKAKALLGGEGLLGGWSGGVRGFDGEEVGGVDAQGDAFLLEGLNDTLAQGAEDAVFLVGPDAKIDRVHDLAAGDLVDARDVRISEDERLEGGVVADFHSDGGEDAEDVRRIGTGVDADVEVGYGEVAGQVGDGGNLAVGDGVKGAVAVAEGGGAEGEVFDGAGERGDLDHLANVILVFDKDEDAIEHVFEETLRAETDADANDPGGGEERGQVDVEDRKDVEQDDEAEDADCGGADDGGDGTELGGAGGVALGVTVGQMAEAVDKEVNDALKREGDDQDEDEARKIVPGEVDQINVPVATEGFEVLALGGGLQVGECGPEKDGALAFSAGTCRCAERALIVYNADRCKVLVKRRLKAFERAARGGVEMKLAKIVASLVMAVAPVALSQQGTVPGSVPPPAFGGGAAGTEGGAFGKSTQERLEKGRQTDRQRRLMADTDRLLTLATELKADMDRTTKDTLSIEVIKKAEEIEKLAKSVKERMKG